MNNQSLFTLSINTFVIISLFFLIGCSNTSSKSSSDNNTDNSSEEPIDNQTNNSINFLGWNNHSELSGSVGSGSYNNSILYKDLQLTINKSHSDLQIAQAVASRRSSTDDHLVLIIKVTNNSSTNYYCSITAYDVIYKNISGNQLKYNFSKGVYGSIGESAYGTFDYKCLAPSEVGYLTDVQFSMYSSINSVEIDEIIGVSSGRNEPNGSLMPESFITTSLYNEPTIGIKNNSLSSITLKVLNVFLLDQNGKAIRASTSSHNLTINSMSATTISPLFYYEGVSSSILVYGYYTKN